MEEEKKVVEQAEVSQEASTKAPVQNRRPDQKQGQKPDQRPNRDGKRKFDGKKGDRKGQQGPRRKEFEEQVINISRVTKVVKGGKRLKFQALVVIGDKKGRYGFGIGKSGEVPDAIKKAVEAAKKNMYKVNIVRGDTITHDIIGKFGATEVFLKPAKPGTGIVAGGPVRAVLELAGLKNVYSKVHGSRTAINIIRATDNAIRNIVSYTHEQDLRK